MRYPQLVLDGDWAKLEQLTGVLTNAHHLDALVKRCVEKTVTDAALKVLACLLLSF